jgi:hypothetical protein
LTGRLGFKALTGAIPRKEVWPVTVCNARTFTTASPKVRKTQDLLARFDIRMATMKTCLVAASCGMVLLRAVAA